MHFKDKGIILISCLLIVMLLSSVAALMGNNLLISLKRAAYLEFQTTSLNLFRNIESIALKRIKTELNFNKVLLSKQNTLFREKIFFENDLGLVDAEIKDFSNCFNINSLVTKTTKDFVPNKNSVNALKRYLFLMEVDNNVIEEIIDQVIDWIDTNSNPRAFGREDYYYTGPLNNPKEYTSRRIFYSIDEIKMLPALKNVDWSIFSNFCALPYYKSLKININTLESEDTFLLSSIMPNIALSEAEYIISSIPDEGIRSLEELSQLFPDKNFSDPLGEISFFSNIFNLETKVTYKDYTSLSNSIIFYNKNNGYIISRIYDGI